MKARKLMTTMLSAAVLSAVASTAYAQEAQGHVTFYADKAVIGQGMVTEPVRVPYYEGESGIDIVQRAADVIVADGEWGGYIEGFADTDTGAPIPEEILAVCPEIGGRNSEGSLCSYDYTAESGWSWFLNDEQASVGIGDYIPADGDVIQFRFTVYGYGSDLGIDNSSWGGNPALVEAVKTAELAELMADNVGTEKYSEAVKVLGTFGVSQEEIDAAAATFSEAADGAQSETSPDTGANGIAAVVGVAVLAGALLVSTKKK